VTYNGHLFRAKTTTANAPPDTSLAAWESFDPTAGAPSESGDLSQVKGSVTCLVQRGSQFTAVFGYSNPTSTVVVEPVGRYNKFLPTPDSSAMGRGQPVTFLVGPHPAAFAVDFTGPTLTWLIAAQQAVTINVQTTSVPACITTSSPDGPVVKIGSDPPLLLHPDSSSVLNSAIGPSSPVGSLPGQFEVTNDGAASYSIPLWTPPARMDIGPRLSLTYSSRAGRGLAGFGWNLSGFGVSRITRCNKNLALDGDATPIGFDADDAFCLDGQRLLPTGEPRVGGALPFAPENDPFTRVFIDSKQTAFHVYLRDGRILDYGTTLNSRHHGPRAVWAPTPGGTPTNPNGATDFTYAWALSSLRDPSGNRMDVQYEAFTDDTEALAPAACTELLPSVISYTAGPTAQQAPLRFVQFSYERPGVTEPSCKYVAGFGVGAQARLRQVTMQGPSTSTTPATPATLRTYNLSYHQSALTHRSLLDSLQECDAAGKSCLPATKFDYAPGHSEYAQSAGILDSLSSGRRSANDLQFKDLNGDGKDDVLFTSFDPGDPDATVYSPTWQRAYALSEGTRFGTPHVYAPDPVLWTAEPWSPTGTPSWYPGAAISLGAAVGTNGNLSTHFLIDSVPVCSGIMVGHRPHAVCRGTGVAANDLDLNTDLWWPHPYTWDGYAPFFIGDFDGNGTQDLITARQSSSITSWNYWLNSGTLAPNSVPVAMKELKDPMRPLTMSKADDRIPLYAYVASLDGTGKTAFLFRQGASDDAGDHDAENLVAAVAHPNTGDISSIETTLPVGPQMAVDGSNRGATFHYLFIDLNADGNADALQIPFAGGSPMVALNTGAGFGPLVPLTGTVNDSPYQFPAAGPVAPEAPPPPASVMRIADLNEDGLPDLFIANNSEAASVNEGGPVAAYLSAGANGVVPTLLKTDTGLPIGQGGLNSYTGAPLYGVELFDMDGDGFPEIYAGGSVYAHVRDGYGKADALIGIHDGLAKDTNVSYAAIASDASSADPLYERGTTCQYPQQCLSSGLWVVNHYSTSADWSEAGKPTGAPGSSLGPAVEFFDFRYADARADARGRGFLGFAKKVETNGNTHAITETSFDNGETDTGFGYPRANHPSSMLRTTQLSGSTYRSQYSSTKYRVTPVLNGLTALVQPLEVLAHTEENEGTPDVPGLGSAAISSSTTSYQFDDFGNLALQETTYANGDVYRVSAHFDQNRQPGKWLLSLPRDSSETSVVGSRSVSRTRSFDTDPATGLIRSEKVQPSGDASVAQSITYEHNALGQVTHVAAAATDPLTSAQMVREIWTTFDDFDGIFPATQTNSLGQVTRSVVHPGLGVPVFTSDVNGVATHSRYDGFGRLISRSVPGHGTTTLSYESGRPYAEQNGTLPGLLTIETDQQGFGHSIVTYNANNHEVVRGERNHDGTFSYAETHYANPLYLEGMPGTIAWKSLPHKFAVPSVLKSFSYDAIGRPTSMILPDGTRTTEQYYGLASVATDPRGFARTTVRDQQGRVARIDEESQMNVAINPQDPTARSTSAISTNYSYGPFGVLEGISVTARAENGGATTQLDNMQFDDLGRRISVVDADSGQQTTIYNAFGEVESEADAMGQVHVFGRDALGRVVEDYSSTEGATTFQWDAAPGGVGQIAIGTSSDQITTTFAYDPFGRRVGTTLQTGSGSYNVTTDFDDVGHTKVVHYPTVAGVAPFSVTYTTDAIGEPKSVNSNDPASPFSWRISKWQADGQVLYEAYGVNASESGTTMRSYDSNRGWLNGISTVGTTTVQDLSYHYDTSGHLSEREDGVAGTKETFHNDFAHRLDTWSYASSAGVTNTYFGYSDLGNLSSKTTYAPSGQSTLNYAPGTRDAAGTPGNAGVHAVVSDGGHSFSYDANGNQLTGPGRTITYTSFNLPASVNTYSMNNFKYDAWHHRAQRVGFQGYTYVGDLYERRNAMQLVDHVFYVPLGGRIVGQVDVAMNGAAVGSRKISYLHTDSLGSTESLTGPTAAPEHFKYDPFGKRIDAGTLGTPLGSSSGVRLGFTGQEQEDDLNGLINMRGRIYDPQIGRFLSTDPLVANFKSSQGFNRYSYVYNNPLNYIDPSGLYGTGTSAAGGSIHSGCPEFYAPGSMPADGCLMGVSQDADGVWTVIGQAEEITVIAKPPLPESEDSNGSSTVIDESMEYGVDYLSGTVLTPENAHQGLKWGAASVAIYGAAFGGAYLYALAAESPLLATIGTSGTTATGKVLSDHQEEIVEDLEELQSVGDAAAEEVVRGVGRFGGVVSTSSNPAGGLVVTTQGQVAGSDFTAEVNAGVMQGMPVNILSGVHGTASGAITPAPQFVADDIAMFGHLPGVTIHDTLSLTGAQINGMLSGPGMTIGAFCHSEVCLAPFK